MTIAGNEFLLTTFVFMGLGLLLQIIVAYWLYRIWAKTGENAYRWLFWAEGALPLLVFPAMCLTGVVIVLIARIAGILGGLNLAITLTMSVMAVFGSYLQYALLFAALSYIENGRVGVRQLLPLGMQRRWESRLGDSQDADTKFSIRSVRWLFLALCMYEAATCVAVLAGYSIPIDSLVRLPPTVMLVLIAGWWLYQLWDVTDNGVYSWLIAALCIVPFLQILTAQLLPPSAMTPPAPAGAAPATPGPPYLSAIASGLRELVFTCLRAGCMVMALCQMAGGVVGVRDLFTSRASRRVSAEDD